MKLIFIVISLIAAVSGRATPITSHTLEIGSNGFVGTSILSPLVSIIININKGLENLISIEGSPSEAVITPVTPALPSPALTENPQQPIVADNAPEAIIVVDQAPVQPQPIIIVDQSPETVTIIDHAPVQPQPIIVNEVPESVVVVDQVQVHPVVIVEQAPEPVTVVESAPETVIVVDQALVTVPEPVIVGPAIIDNLVPSPTPVSDSSSSVTNNFLINVLFNLVLGSDSSSSSGPVTVASGPSMSDVIQQIFGSFLPLATAPRV